MINPPNIQEAYAFCEQLTRNHYENFPVGSVLVPKAKRKHIYSIYAFARTADDFADEGYDGQTTTEDRLRLLDDWERQLDECLVGNFQHPIFAALQQTIRELDLPVQLFKDLLSAFRQDVMKTRYQDFAEVLDYCRRSANPVGRLILLLFDYRDEKLFQLSDQVCTALQLANFWQDVSVDLAKDRVYLPLDEIKKFNFSEVELFGKTCNDSYRELLKFQVNRTQKIFDEGKLLPGLVRGKLRLELKLTWLGGTQILRMIEKNNYDTLSYRPSLSKFDKVKLLGRLFKVR
jgi:hydroxysqualene synthase